MKKYFGLVALFALALMPGTAAAGPICSGIKCVAFFGLVAWYAAGSYLLPGLLLLGLIFIVAHTIARRRHAGCSTTIIISASMIIGLVALLLVGSLVRDHRANQAIERQEASALPFTLYEPTYVPRGYKLESVKVDTTSGSLRYWYYNQQDSEFGYSLVIEASQVDTLSDTDAIARRKLGGSTAEVFKAGKGIGVDEANRVLDSLRQVSAANIDVP